MQECWKKLLESVFERFFFTIFFVIFDNEDEEMTAKLICLLGGWWFQDETGPAKHLHGGEARSLHDIALGLAYNVQTHHTGGWKTTGSLSQGLGNIVFAILGCPGLDMTHRDVVGTSAFVLVDFHRNILEEISISKPQSLYLFLDQLPKGFVASVKT